MNDQKITVSKEELKDIVDKRIEERINNKRNEGKNKQSEGLDRREFLKKAGMGAAGLAALGLSPAAATIDIRHPDNMILHNSDLDMNDIINVGNLGGGGSGSLPQLGDVNKISNSVRMEGDESGTFLSTSGSGKLVGGDVFPSGTVQQADEIKLTIEADGTSIVLRSRGDIGDEGFPSLPSISFNNSLEINYNYQGGTSSGYYLANLKCVAFISN
jgi:hypothetical protein